MPRKKPKASRAAASAAQRSTTQRSTAQRGAARLRWEGEVGHPVHAQRLHLQHQPLQRRVQDLGRAVLREGIVEVGRGEQPAGRVVEGDAGGTRK